MMLIFSFDSEQKNQLSNEGVNLSKNFFCLLFTSLRAMKKQEGFSLYQIATSRL